MAKLRLIISGCIAFSVYSLILYMIFSQIQTEDIIKYKIKKVQTVLEIDIINMATIKKNELAQKQIEHKVVETIVNESSSKSSTKTTNLKSLFADVSTKVSKKVIDNVNNIEVSKTQKRFKSKYEKEKKVDKIKLAKVLSLKDNEIKQISKTINQSDEFAEYDEYYSKINNLILRKWYNFPLISNAKYEVVVNVSIDTQGNFSYYIISKSGVKNVDTAIESFLENQKVTRYPIPPDNLTKKIKVNFKPE